MSVALDPRHAIGGNLPPLAELLAEETAPLKARADELIASAGRAAVTDDATAGKATLLAGMLKRHSKDIDEARKARKEPFLQDGRLVDSTFNAIMAKVDEASRSVVGLINAYQAEQHRKAEAERRRQEEEARALAEKAAQAAAQALDVDDEIEAAGIAQRAEEARQRAAEVTARPIDSGAGAVAGTREVWTGTIVDFKKALAHAVKVDRATIEEAVQGVLNRQVRAKIREFPGCEITKSLGTVIR